MPLLSPFFASTILYRKPNLCYAKSNLFSTCVSSSAAEKFFAHLQKNGSKNMERTLDKVKAKLDASCVSAVLKRCVFDNNPQMGLRFFIWAGLQKSTYRHSSYMYNKACELLEIKRDSRIVDDVLEAYRVEDCGVVGVKMFKVVFGLCREAKDAALGLLVLRKMKEFNCRPDTVSYNVVVRLVCEKGEMDEAMGLVREMGSVDLYPDMITYVSIIKGLCEVGKLEEACGLVKEMRAHGCRINVVVFTNLVDAVCRFGSLERALELLREMEKEGGDCKPNVVTYTTLIKGFVQKGRSMDALSILDQMDDSGCKPNRITVATLIDGLCTEGHVEEAYNVVDRVGSGIRSLRDDCYSSLLLSLWRIRRYQEAESFFRMMLANGIKPDGAASSTVIKGLCSKGRFKDGFLLYDKLEKSGFISTIDSEIYSTLLAGLCQDNHLVEAANLARMMTNKGIKLRAPYVDDVVRYLENFGEQDLASNISTADE